MVLGSRDGEWGRSDRRRADLSERAFRSTRTPVPAAVLNAGPKTMLTVAVLEDGNVRASLGGGWGASPEPHAGISGFLGQNRSPWCPKATMAKCPRTTPPRVTTGAFKRDRAIPELYPIRLEPGLLPFCFPGIILGSVPKPKCCKH